MQLLSPDRAQKPRFGYCFLLQPVRIPPPPVMLEEEEEEEEEDLLGIEWLRHATGRCASELTLGLPPPPPQLLRRMIVNKSSVPSLSLSDLNPTPQFRSHKAGPWAANEAVAVRQPLHSFIANTSPYATVPFHLQNSTIIYFSPGPARRLMIAFNRRSRAAHEHRQSSSAKVSIFTLARVVRVIGSGRPANSLHHVLLARRTTHTGVSVRCARKRPCMGVQRGAGCFLGMSQWW